MSFIPLVVLVALVGVVVWFVRKVKRNTERNRVMLEEARAARINVDRLANDPWLKVGSNRDTRQMIDADEKETMLKMRRSRV